MCLLIVSESQFIDLKGDLRKSNVSAYAEGSRKNLRVQWESFLLFCVYFHLTFLPVKTDLRIFLEEFKLVYFKFDA